MRGENNLFLKAVAVAQPPWQHKTVNPGRSQRLDQIVDLSGRPIIDFHLPGGDYTPEQYRKTIALVEHAPQLLAALTELAFNMEQHNIIATEEIAQMIYDCGGADLRDHYAAKRANLEQAQSRKPQQWNNATQSLDNE